MLHSDGVEATLSEIVADEDRQAVRLEQHEDHALTLNGQITIVRHVLDLGLAQGVADSVNDLLALAEDNDLPVRREAVTHDLDEEFELLDVL